MAAKGVGRRDAERVLSFIEQKYSSPDEVGLGFGPQLVEDWDWIGSHNWTIVWEGGPYEWAIDVTEFADKEYPWNPALVPFYLEPYSSYALCVWHK